MGILEDFAKTLNKSLYDPPRLEVDGIAHETNIPEVEEGYRDPVEGAYPHSDFTRDPGVEGHLVTDNALEPHGEYPAAQEDWREPKEGTPEAPEWGVSAPANQMSTAQYALNPGGGVKILNPNLQRVTVLIQNLSATASVNVSGTSAGVVSGIVLSPNQSLELSYCGELFANATAINTVVAIAEFYRNRA